MFIKEKIINNNVKWEYNLKGLRLLKLIKIMIQYETLS